MTLDELLEELLAHVLHNLSPRDLVMTSRACRLLRAAAEVERRHRIQVFGSRVPEAWAGGAVEAAGQKVNSDGGCHVVHFYPDGSRLVGVGSAASERELTVYRRDASVVGVLQGHDDIVFSVTTDGVLIASGDEEGVIRLWDAVSLQAAGQLQHGSRIVLGLALLGDLLVSGSEDRTVKRWAVSQQQCTATLTEHTGFVASVAVSDEVIATGSYDCSARIWPLESTASRHTLQHPAAVKEAPDCPFASPSQGAEQARTQVRYTAP